MTSRDDATPPPPPDYANWLRALALEEVCPNSLNPVTPYEFHAIKRLEEFGAKVLEKWALTTSYGSARSEIRESEPPCRVGDAVGMLMKAAKGLYNSFEPDNQSALYCEMDAFIRSIHPFECGPLAKCSSVAATRPSDDAKNAARYRWLRSEEVATAPRHYIFWNEFNAKLCREEKMDALIDAEMASKEPDVSFP